jgi:hypothetical protein
MCAASPRAIGRREFVRCRGNGIGDGTVAKNNRSNNASDLLGDWRAAQRDTTAAKAAKSIAEMANAAAQAADEAATETEAAARAALEAAERAGAAASLAKRAATHAAEAAQLAAATAEGDVVRADIALTQAEDAETTARDRFHDADKRRREET